eukprot:TRINITY_DN28607_c0_g1_i1.p1 TRINITY_DN28607_c0_g1~~TRINITY_DN28607_c0_g1_i1.p1  ORF type:complete len:334 (+),score=79.19 TRINITY_DN28607_c0_g1_i1:201-1202(+)
MSAAQLEQELNELNRQRFDVEQRLRELAVREQRAQARKAAQQRVPLSYAGKRLRDGVAENSVEAETDFANKRPKTLSSLIVDPHESSSQSQEAQRPRVSSALVSSAAAGDDNQQQQQQRESSKGRLPAVQQKPEETKRSKRVFGLLLGTLQRAQTELGSKSAAARRRDAAEQRAEAKVHNNDHDAYSEQQQLKLQEEKDKELARRTEIDQQRNEKELELLELKWKMQDNLLSHWFKTDAQPAIFYRPKNTLKEDRVPIAKSESATATSDEVESNGVSSDHGQEHTTTSAATTNDGSLAATGSSADDEMAVNAAADDSSAPGGDADDDQDVDDG